MTRGFTANEVRTLVAYLQRMQDNIDIAPWSGRRPQRRDALDSKADAEHPRAEAELHPRHGHHQRRGRFEVIIPMLMANLIDYGIDAGNMNYIVKMGLVLLLSAAGQLLCGIASGKFAAEASSGFARNLRHDMFYKVQNFSFPILTSSPRPASSPA